MGWTKQVWCHTVLSHTSFVSLLSLIKLITSNQRAHWQINPAAIYLITPMRAFGCQKNLDSTPARRTQVVFVPLFLSQCVICPYWIVVDNNSTQFVHYTRSADHTHTHIPFTRGMRDGFRTRVVILLSSIYFSWIRLLCAIHV